MSHIVVIGAGQAGQSLVSKLRALGFDGRLTLIGEEPVPPYQRPPLSKKYMLGEMEKERLFLRPESFYADQGIELLLGERVSGIDPEARTVSLGDRTLHWDRLALTTGAVALRLPAAIGGTLAGVHTVRSLADADAMAPQFVAGRRVLIVGGGYIGLEAAAVAARKGLKVTLVEMAERILGRVASRETADFIRAIHRREGVDIREGVGLEALSGEARVSGARLSDGTQLPVDFVIVGVGIRPATALAEAAGLAIDNGIAVDAFGRSSHPAVWAAGDCASFPHAGGRLRLESVGNAIDQAENVAENMLGADKPYRPRPWFWSDQFDMKLQIAGLNSGYEKVIMRPGDGQDSASFWYFDKAGTLLAVDAINDPRAYMIGKRLIEAGKSPAIAAVADAGGDLRALLKG